MGTKVCVKVVTSMRKNCTTAETDTLFERSESSDFPRAHKRARTTGENLNGINFDLEDTRRRPSAIHTMPLDVLYEVYLLLLFDSESYK